MELFIWCVSHLYTHLHNYFGQSCFVNINFYIMSSTSSIPNFKTIRDPEIIQYMM